MTALAESEKSLQWVGHRGSKTVKMKNFGHRYCQDYRWI
jgi:hypothetical protein